MTSSVKKKARVLTEKKTVTVVTIALFLRKVWN